MAEQRSGCLSATFELPINQPGPEHRQIAIRLFTSELTAELQLGDHAGELYLEQGFCCKRRERRLCRQRLARVLGCFPAEPGPGSEPALHLQPSKVKRRQCVPARGNQWLADFRRDSGGERTGYVRSELLPELHAGRSWNGS